MKRRGAQRYCTPRLRSTLHMLNRLRLYWQLPAAVRKVSRGTKNYDKGGPIQIFLAWGEREGRLNKLKWFNVAINSGVVLLLTVMSLRPNSYAGAGIVYYLTSLFLISYLTILISQFFHTKMYRLTDGELMLFILGLLVLGALKILVVVWAHFVINDIHIGSHRPGYDLYFRYFDRKANLEPIVLLTFLHMISTLYLFNIIIRFVDILLHSPK